MGVFWEQNVSNTRKEGQKKPGNIPGFYYVQRWAKTDAASFSFAGKT